jgi:lauroyl/myristoyl acyltransferase
MSSPGVTVAARIAVNIKFLAVRVVGLVIRVVPFRAALLNGLGVVTGLFFMLLRTGQWKAIIGFARHTSSTLPALVYLLKYFVQQGKDGIWGYIFSEAPSALARYLTVQDAEALERASTGGKGVIVLGAHYGPVLYAYMLSRMHFDVKAHISGNFARQLENDETLVLKPFRSSKVKFLREPGAVLVARKDEKSLVDHVRRGGMVVMEIDFPGPRGREGRVPFFGIPIRTHAFPFRLALAYGVPVFFCFFGKEKRGAYRMDLISAGEFATPEEGFRQYLACLEVRIGECPFLWSMMPRFFRRR